MKTYVGPLMNSFTELERVRLSDQFLDSILDAQPQVPVVINFGSTIVGTTRAFAAKEGFLYCEFDLDTDIPDIASGYLVPGIEGIKYHNEEGTRIIDSALLTGVSINIYPSTALTFVKRIKLKGEK